MNSAYYDMVKQHVEENFPDTHILGHFLCQGCVQEATIERYRSMVKEHPDDIHIRAQLDNYEAGRKHPDEEDLQHAREFARSIG